jgi:hypothetical protein
MYSSTNKGGLVKKKISPSPLIKGLSCVALAERRKSKG